MVTVLSPTTLSTPKVGTPGMTGKLGMNLVAVGMVMVPIGKTWGAINTGCSSRQQWAFLTQRFCRRVDGSESHGGCHDTGSAHAGGSHHTGGTDREASIAAGKGGC